MLDWKATGTPRETWVIQARRHAVWWACGLTLCGQVWAQVGGLGAIERQSELLQRQQQERLKALQDQAKPAESAVQGADLRQPPLPPATGQAHAPCWPIDEIALRGADHLGRQALMEIQASHAGRCLKAADIQHLMGELTQAYVSRGMVTTRVYLPAQELGSRRLVLDVAEGRIEAFRIEGDGGSRLWLTGLFPTEVGEVLNLRDLEQGIEQANRLGSNNTTMEIEPGTQPDRSVVVLRNAKRPAVRGQLSFDNQGSKSTGQDALSLNLTADAPLGLNERWVLSRRQSWLDGRGKHASTSTGLDVWMPWGNHSLGLNVSVSDYVNVLSLPSGQAVRTDGDTATTSANIERVVYRDQSSRAQLLGRLSTQETRNRLAGELLSTSSRTLTHAELGAGGSTVVAQGFLTGQLVYAQGLNWLSAKRDADGLDREAPRAQFRKATVDVSYNREFWAGETSLGWSSQLSVQHAWDTLYGAQQMLIGSLSTVRGFTRNTLSGDRGVVWRNELFVPTRFGSGSEAVNGRVYTALDMGHVRNRATGVPSGGLGGITLGASAVWQGLSLDVFASQPAWLPSSMQRESTQLWARLAVSF
ncbi:ShlB/FhaC/HecB family hemolysin secretion/activation protein [Aquabacterium sp.]|uniref:ShlB/FhaC/HecB family hemolysin secretion/activation protein n=1 Tax=Aquabacterium sp. TaxID=1872578 RepID=UPI0025C0DC59|nr:ShlB/FhaC/HecB family hemolysin secretion/activation protein [Aquabacterium sp.]